MNLISNESKTQYNINEPIWIGAQNDLLNIEFEAKFDLKKIKNNYPNLWRYSDAIAINQKEGIISFNEGFTPLEKIKINNKTIYIKHEHLFNTGSYKDRGATTLITKAHQLGIKKIVQDSSGNAGCAIAAYAAKAQIECNIYLPNKTSKSKIKQMEAYHANIIKIKGTRLDASEAALQAAQTTYYASHCYNPWFFEGTKTFAFEICEQLNWKSPDAVILPAGNGTLVIGCHIGFEQLAKAGIINKIPKIIAIQSENCCPLHDNFWGIKRQTDYGLKTIAEGIAIVNAPRHKQIIDAVKNTNGTFITVSENEILKSWKKMSQIGNYIETTSAAAIAGAEKYMLNHNDNIMVTLFSGTGLKNK